MSENKTREAVKAFHERHHGDIEALAKDLWAVRRQGRPTAPDGPGHWGDLSTDERFRLKIEITELVFDEDNRVRIRRMLRLPLVRELFEARDISFSRAAQLLGLSCEGLRLIARDDEWKARCPQEAEWWKTGEGDAGLPWDNPAPRSVDRVRGMKDALKGLPPAETTADYLEGYRKVSEA